MNHRNSISVLLLFSIALLALIWPLEGSVERAIAERHPNKAVTTTRQGDILPAGTSEGGLFKFLQAAGMNALLADLLWMKADDLWHSASWWQMAPVMEAIVKIDTRFVLVWRVLAWHYGWNLFVASPTEVERQQWLAKAEDAYYRGVAANPKDYDLYADMCWFFVDKVRRDDKAIPLLIKGVEKFPEQGIDTIQRQLQRVYERTWLPELAMETIADIGKKRPKDPLVKRDMEWWVKHRNDQNWRWILEDREQVTRQSRDLPPYLNPFEGKTVKSPFTGKTYAVSVPVWRDMNEPDYRDPKWRPQVWQYEVQSVERMWQRYPDLQKQWEAHNPGQRSTIANTGHIEAPNPSDPYNGPIRQYMSRKITYKELVKKFGGRAPMQAPQPGPDGYAPKGSTLDWNKGSGRMGPGMGPGMGRGMGPGMGRGMGPGMGPGMGRGRMGPAPQ